MKIIIRAVLASAALCAIFGQAGNAADDPGPANPPPLAPPVLAPMYSWTGIYIGINVGYGAARLMESASSGADSLSASESGSGLIAGGQIGANYQSGVFVVGLEVDEQWSNQRNTYNLFGTNVTDKVVAFGTARVRGGIAMDRVLLYLTGGGAYAVRNVAVPTASSVSAIPTASVSVQRTGFVGGAGVEGLITPKITLRAEYLYMQTFDDTSTISGAQVTSHVSDNIFRVGINFKPGR
jgi:outer membrane immunogenic protein